MISAAILSLSLMTGGQVVAPPSPQAPQELSVLVERVVRLADLHRRKLDLEQELATKPLGRNHPEAIALRLALADVVAAIQREGLQSFRTDAYLLAERRMQLENELARLQVGRAHPEHRSATAKLAALREQQRTAAVAALAGGLEAHLRDQIARTPNELSPYLSLAELFSHAGRADDAAAVLSDAQAVLKRAGGR